MEQLEQLASIRDAAEKRLEEARAALERSPDAKLVASLTLLIDDLKKSFEAEGAAAADTADAETDTADTAVEESPVEADAEPNSALEPEVEAAQEEASDPAPESAEEAAEAAPASEEFSLEDSLEAELLNVEDGASKS